MDSIPTLAAVLAGGGIGSVARWLVGLGVGERYKGSFPLGTFIINVTGAFLIGYLTVAFKIDWKDRYGSHMAAFVLTGLLGGYTTFSSYQLDTGTLYNDNQRRLAALYWIGSVAAGLAAAVLGVLLARPLE